MTPKKTSLPPNLTVWQKSLRWAPTTAQQQQFQTLYEGILVGNQQFNLTRITEPEAFWEKHLWDSLSGIEPWLTDEPPDWLPQYSPSQSPRIIDIGTGGGFPGMPVAIALPNSHVTFLDSTRKKIQFLETLAQQLSFPKTAFVADRAETVGHHRNHRGRYDIALVRAVGPASTCAEYALPLLDAGGMAVLFRGQWSDEDSQTLEKALPPLGASLTEVQAFVTPLTQGVRHCVYLQKTGMTEIAYPRAVGIPAKQPL
ncbi:MAG: 16S rRNA (guanine(527)-N(7))-methyltransferase RsmG [Cyanobacteria bacterium P01_D01_bin.44]